MSVYANAANEDDRITKQFQKLFEKPGEADESGDTSPRQSAHPLQFFNITDKIIDKITIYAEYELGINQLKKNKIKDLQ